MALGPVQKWAFLGLAIAWILSTIGAISPYWESASADGYTAGAGLWYVCATAGVNSACVYLRAEGTSPVVAKYWVCRMFSLFGVLACLTSLLSGWCLSRGGVGGRTVSQGILALVAGGLYIITLAVYGSISEFHSYGWSFILFVIGTIITCIVGLLLTFIKPYYQTGTPGMIMSGAPAGGVIISNTVQQGYVGPVYPYQQQNAGTGYDYVYPYPPQVPQTQFKHQEA